jgi:hypothetical protein
MRGCSCKRFPKVYEAVENDEVGRFNKAIVGAVDPKVESALRAKRVGWKKARESDEGGLAFLSNSGGVEDVGRFAGAADGNEEVGGLEKFFKGKTENVFVA